MQKSAICRRCGKPIWLVRCVDNNKWVSCDVELRRFTPSDGPNTYVTEDGKICRGTTYIDGAEMFGYRKHRKDCATCKNT